MPPWPLSRWFSSPQSPGEQEYQGSDSTQYARVRERMLQSTSENEFGASLQRRRRIDDDEILDQDLQYLDGRGTGAVPEQERARAAQLVGNSQFISWLNSPLSGHLLVHGRFERASHISGLSLWCRSLVRDLAVRTPRSIPLVFFCGLHTRPPSFIPTAVPSYDNTQLWSDAGIGPPDYRDDIEPPVYRFHQQDMQMPRSDNSQLGVPSTSGHTLIRSFIHQLLRHLPDLSIKLKFRELDGIENKDLMTLCELFKRFVGLLPRDVEVYCLVDGAEYYEQEAESWDSASWVLSQLVLLSNLRNNEASVHLMITTPTSTSHISEWFQSRRILSMEETGRGEEMVPDSTTLQGELDDVIEQGQQYSNPLDPWYSAVGPWEE
ncbi:hypothetical protein Daus18300_003246 [Diaporthe australafricana]|uniref:Uncharacterized protein n=1 Tax=Diaporthe australafricana TaxID=127596 RepID=A0ABR3XGY8_9PEZI